MVTTAEIQIHTIDGKDTSLTSASMKISSDTSQPNHATLEIGGHKYRIKAPELLTAAEVVNKARF